MKKLISKNNYGVFADTNDTVGVDSLLVAVNKDHGVTVSGTVVLFVTTSTNASCRYKCRPWARVPWFDECIRYAPNKKETYDKINDNKKLI